MSHEKIYEYDLDTNLLFMIKTNISKYQTNTHLYFYKSIKLNHPRFYLLSRHTKMVIK